MIKQQNIYASVLLLTLLLVYSISFFPLFREPWSSDANAHGPMILVLSIWFFFRQLFRVKNGIEKISCESKTSSFIYCLAWLSIAIGLLFFIVGFSQGVYLLTALSLPFISAGLTIAVFGSKVFSRVWFAFLLMLFMVPLPLSIIDALTMPMKSMVSWCAEHILYALGYPIYREGVVLSLGPYKLLVADACSGLNSLFVLEALGLLYLNLVKHESFTRNMVLAIFIVPISFSANVIRVIALSLITFYLGDEAGQGFLHNLAGFVLFAVALTLIIFVDAGIRLVLRYASVKNGVVNV